MADHRRPPLSPFLDFVPSTGNEVRYLRFKHRKLIGRLERGLVDVTSHGSISIKKMAELTMATSNEIGLWRLRSGKRVLQMGQATSLDVPAGAIRAIAHTHPSGSLKMSFMRQTQRRRGIFDYGDGPRLRPVEPPEWHTFEVGDVPTIRRINPAQRSHIVIGPTGQFSRQWLDSVKPLVRREITE